MKLITPHLAKETGSQIPQCSELEQQQQQFPHVSGLVLTACTAPADICQHSLGTKERTTATEAKWFRLQSLDPMSGRKEKKRMNPLCHKKIHLKSLLRFLFLE